MAFLDTLTPVPKSRNFICGSVGSGKSTVACALLENYARLHPTHRIYIVDPKRRYFPVIDRKSYRMFPQGFAATNHGRTDGVTVNARLLTQAHGYRFPHERAFVVQEAIKALDLYLYLFEKHDVRTPVMLFLDESIDAVRGVRAVPQLRRLIQMGRELGIGTCIINQRPAYVDATFLTESDRLYVGHLNNPADRRKLADYAAIADPAQLLVPVPKHVFWMIDQAKPELSTRFKLSIGA